MARKAGGGGGRGGLNAVKARETKVILKCSSGRCLPRRIIVNLSAAAVAAAAAAEPSYKAVGVVVLSL